MNGQDIIFNKRLIRQFDISGPRYTSYPSADRFIEAFTADHYKHWLGQRGRVKSSRPLSLYIHIPFCPTICYYCACNKIITKDHGRSAKYIHYLEKEMDLVLAELAGSHEVAQMHWGGGSPSFLTDDELQQLIALVRHRFDFLPDGEYSIEVDPRKVSTDTVSLLAELGFNRMSIGVQDFSPDVQRAVNRIQSIEETRRVMDAARESGFKSLAVDLIYGLPKQNVISFSHTLDEVIKLDPDRLSIYNYAHVPNLAKPQRRINVAELPSAETRLQILQLAIRRLTDAGYVFIGMDHFAKPSDELAVAQRQGRLHRNFQGYSTHPEADLVAFGVSSIGKIGPTYVQNVRSLNDYYDRLDQGLLPVLRGIQLTPDDLLRRGIIQALMCHFSVPIDAIEIAHLINFKDYFETELADLVEMEKEGLLTVTDQWITVSPMGRLLVRAIAMVFDRYLRFDRERIRYSKVI
jgi:oxygen-independent coproporphyrinogen-3 oxidase